jgi:hypothetical protein
MLYDGVVHVTAVGAAGGFQGAGEAALKDLIIHQQALQDSRGGRCMCRRTYGVSVTLPHQQMYEKYVRAT